MTWSIIAFDKSTGAFGAAVAAKAFASGSFVPFVRAGVGAVGTQSLTNRYLALQLFFCFEVRALSGGLVSPTPE